MLGMQSVRPGSLSPKGTDTLLWDDIDSKRRTGNISNATTFDILTRRFTTFTSTTSSSQENKVQFNNADDTMRQIKIRIIKHNPMIFNMLREYLIARRCYTDVTVSCMLNQFLDVELRIPELRSDIVSHQLSYTDHHRYRNANTTTSSMLFAYLTGESLSPSSSTIVSPNKRITPSSMERSVTSNSSYSDTSMSQYSQELSLPSLNSFGQSASALPDDKARCEI